MTVALGGCRPGSTLAGVFVGLVKDPGAGWGPPDEPSPRPRRSWPPVPWRLLAWIGVLVALFAVSRTVGGLPGYAIILVTVAAGSLRLDRQLGPVARGLRDYQA